jgi:Pentapeptide repeats (8 copies)
MTHEPIPLPEDEVEHWLERQHRNLIEDLREVLDLDTGLREINIEQQHASLESGLRQVLDLDAGLRDIVAETSREQPAPIAVEPPARSFKRASIEAILAARTEPVVRTALKLFELARAVHLISHVPALDLADDAVLASVRVSIRALTSEIRGVGVVGLASDLASGLGRADSSDLEYADALNDAQILVGNLASALDLAEDLVLACDIASILDLASGLEHATSLADRLVHALGAARDLARSIASPLVQDTASDLARELDYARYDADALVRARLRGRDRDLGHARVLALALAVYRTLAHTLALVDDIICVVDPALAQALSRWLPGVSLVGLAPEQIGALLDDFTHADLSDVNLRGADLTGLLWSEESTQWPSHEIAAEIRRRSRETRPGAGVFEVIGADGSLAHQTAQV